MSSGTNFGRVGGSGNRQCGESVTFFPDLYNRVCDLAAKINGLTVLHSWNRIELLDQNIKSVTMFAIQSVEVLLRALETSDSIMYQAVHTAIRLGPKQGPVSMLPAPTRLCG